MSFTWIFDPKTPVARAGNGYSVASATWKVIRGTGQYAKITGGGRAASVWSERTDAWSSHMEGVLTLP